VRAAWNPTRPQGTTKVHMVDSTKHNTVGDYFEKLIRSLNHNTHSNGSSSKVLAENCNEICQLDIDLFVFRRFKPAVHNPRNLLAKNIIPNNI
jgi:hypothetical protein